MKSFYLIGDSIGRSLSPDIHSWIYNFLDINAEYKNKKISKREFKGKISQVIEEVKLGLIHGLNITNPYKLEVLSSGVNLSKHAQNINAVNCIYKNENNLIGDNTDWIGFIKSIDYNNINLNNHDIIIIGAGGASRAIIYGLQNLGIKNFEIYNRTKTSLLVNGKKYKTCMLSELEGNTAKNSFLINCIKPDIINKLLSNQNLKSMKYFYDLNYHQSDFHTILEEKDIKVILGLDMLIYQAIKSIEIWLGYELADQINIEEIKFYLKKKSLC